MASTQTDVLVNTATQQIPLASFDLRPASGIEILGIATATCLLTLFLCGMLCAWLQNLWSWRITSLSPGAIGDVRRNQEFTQDKTGLQSPTRKWVFMPAFLVRLQNGQWVSGDKSQALHLGGSADNVRMGRSKRNRNAIVMQCHHSWGPVRGGSISRLLTPSAAPGPARRKTTTLEMEEGLDSLWNIVAAATPVSGTAALYSLSGNGRGSERGLSDADRSFTHCRNASL